MTRTVAVVESGEPAHIAMAGLEEEQVGIDVKMEGLETEMDEELHSIEATFLQRKNHRGP